MSLDLWKAAGGIAAVLAGAWVALLVWGVAAAGGRELTIPLDGDPTVIPTSTMDIVLSVVLAVVAIGAAVAILVVDRRHDARIRARQAGADREREQKRKAA